MANNLWSNYTEKTATPIDADEVMVRDSTDGKNKKLLFGTFWKWVAKKLNEATISELETDNKTIVGALNTLNRQTNIPWLIITYPNNNTIDAIDTPTEYFKNAYMPYAILFIDNKGDSVLGGGASLVLGYSYIDDQYGAQISIKYSDTSLRIRNKYEGKWSNWRII